MGALFSTPKVTPPKAMPDPESPTVRAAEERKRREISGRSGRQSTMLSRRSSGEAGTSAYNNSLLGSAG